MSHAKLSLLSAKHEALLACIREREMFLTQETASHKSVDAISYAPRPVTFNVGGTIFQALSNAFDSHPHSVLYYAAHQLYPGFIKDERDNIFFDRNSNTFAVLLDCIRGYGENLMHRFIDACLKESNQSIFLIDQLLDDFEYYLLDDLKEIALHHLYMTGGKQLIRNRYTRRDQTSRYVYAKLNNCSHISGWSFMSGPGISANQSRFSTTCAIAIVQPTAHAENVSKTLGLHYFPVFVKNAECFGIGIVSASHGNYLDTDFSQTKNCSFYCGKSGLIYSSMCMANDEEVKSLSSDSPAKANETHTYVVPKISPRSVVALSVCFRDRSIRWAVNGCTVCITELGEGLSKFNFAVSGSQNACVELMDTT